jgi:DNA mismatch repair protein MutS2
MSIASQTLDILEFPKIREQLARHTAFSASRELALALDPVLDATTIGRRLALTGEARDLLGDQPEITIGGVRDLRPAAGHAARGGLLEARSLLELALSLSGMRRLRTVLLKQPAGRFPQLADFAYALPELPALEAAIERAIGDDGAVLDSASSELARLRREVRIAFDRLQDRLQHIISASQYADALQEAIITVRNGRYVVPVKAANRRTIRGLVHDQSGSGATLYIEPMAVVELNNRWRELQSAEEEEVARILAELSDLVGNQAQAIQVGIETTALIDLAFAQAKYAEALRATCPELAERDRLGNWTARLIWAPATRRSPDDDAPAVAPRRSLATGETPLLLSAARHPLLDSQTVVPTDMQLGADFQILLITGPNTGGKTVALKTTGLLALMAQSGLHIPAATPSRLPVLGRVFADIGDEQSIEQSLSTFSSHMSNIIRILQALETAAVDLDYDWQHPALPSLVLLDELGAGTDPVEGAALARALIERLLDLDCMAVATTHYAELKAYAYNTPRVQNASMEFDVETLAPTYRLTIGLPGRSNALAIAARLGLDAALVERARAGIDRDDARVEDLLAGIHREREHSAAELQRAEALRADAEKYRERLARDWQEFEDSRAQRAEAAQQELEAELRNVRAELRRLRDEFRSVSLSRQWMEEAEQRLQETQQQVRASAARIRPPAAAAPEPQSPRPLQVGDLVHVRSVGLTGEIVNIDEDDELAEVQVGGFRMRVGLSELRREKGGGDARPERSRAMPALSLDVGNDVSMSFDMRGWRAADVADRLERYLNDAYLAGLHEVRLIHGKGSGALRQVVRDLLREHPLVTSFRGGGSDGGEGVTVASMADR